MDGETHLNNRTEMKSAIFDALESLLHEKPYIEISINDICNQAFISKPTFYRYFKNKENIIHWRTKQFFQEGLVQIGRTCSWQEGYTITTRLFYEHRSIFEDEQSPAFVADFFTFLTAYQETCLIETITCFKGKPVSEKLRIQIQALTIAQSRITRSWATEGMSIPPDVFAEYLTSIVPHDLFKLFNTPKWHMHQKSSITKEEAATCDDTVTQLSYHPVSDHASNSDKTQEGIPLSL